MSLVGLKNFGKPSKYKYEQSVNINRTQNIFNFVIKVPILPLKQALIFWTGHYCIIFYWHLKVVSSFKNSCKRQLIISKIQREIGPFNIFLSILCLTNFSNSVNEVTHCKIIFHLLLFRGSLHRQIIYFLI